MQRKRPRSWTIGLLNSFRLEREGEVVALLGDRRPEEVLAYLAINAGRLVDRADLAKILWPDKELKKARMLLSEVLFRLRAQLQELGVEEDLFVTTKAQIGLRPNVGTDLQQFWAMAAELQTETGGGEHSIEQLVGLHGDGLLPGWESVGWVQHERNAIEQALAGFKAVVHGGVPGAEAQITARPHYRPDVRSDDDADDELTAEALARTGTSLRQMRQVHLQMCCELAEKAEEQLLGPERAQWTKRLEAVAAEINDALEWAIGNDRWESAYRIAGAFWRYWIKREVRKAQRYFEQLLYQAHVSTPRLRTRVLHGAGAIAIEQRDLSRAKAYLEEALRLQDQQGDQEYRAQLLHDLGIVSYLAREDEKARSYFEVALEVMGEGSRPNRELAILKNAALVELRAKQLHPAQELLTRRLELARQLHDTRAEADALLNLATLASWNEDWEEAERLAFAAKEKFTEAQDESRQSFLLLTQGHVYQKTGRHELAEEHYHGSLEAARDRGDMRGVGKAMHCLGELALEQGREDDGQRYLDDADRILSATAAQ